MHHGNFDTNNISFDDIDNAWKGDWDKLFLGHFAENKDNVLYGFFSTGLLDVNPTILDKTAPVYDWANGYGHKDNMPGLADC